MSTRDETPHLIVTAGLPAASAQSMPQQDAEPQPETAEQEN